MGSLVALAVLAALGIGCGTVKRPGSAAVDQGQDAGAADTNATDTDGADTTSSDGGSQVDAPLEGGPTCTAGVACSTNAGAPCLRGQTLCVNGAQVCADGAPASDGTLCTGGACAGGVCLPPTIISGSVNLTTMSMTAGRACGDAAQFAVAGLTATTATLAATPDPGCLAAGDEVMLISLQGALGAVDNVGNWEVLTIGNVAGTTMTFGASKTRFYGAAANSDVGVGTGASDQKVAVVRIPRFGPLTVAAAATLTALPWNGSTGGVVAFHAASLVVNGTISASTLGYRSGRWSQDALCSSTLDTESGESISGPGSASTLRNTGGAGGIAAATGISFSGNTPMGATAGHALPGNPGTNGNGRTVGQPGIAYGVKDGTRLTMGSGPGGNLTCDGGVVSPRYIDSGIVAAGIILVVTGDMTVSATGAITSTAANADRDEAASGGYVFIRGRNLVLGSSLVTARGAVAMGGSPSTQGMTIDASPGYVVLQTRGTVSGTSDPPATIVLGP